MEPRIQTNPLALAASAETVRMLDAHLHQNLDSDAIHACGKNVPPNDLGEIFTVQGGGITGIRHGDEEPHADFIGRFTGLKEDARARDAMRAAHVYKVTYVWVGGTDAHKLRDFAAAASTALLVRGW